MANALIKKEVYSYIPGAPGTPAYPGQPYRAAYTATEARLVCAPRTGSSSPSSSGAPAGRTVVDPRTGQTYWLPTLPPGVSASRVGSVPPGGSSSFASGGVTCRTEYVSTYYPEQPYIPPTPMIPSSPGEWTAGLNLGWNSSARSVQQLEGSGQFNFYVRDNVMGAAVGLSERPDDRSGYVDMRHSWYFASGQAKVYEGGVLVTSYGAYTSADKFTIRRRGTLVDYLVNDAVEYTSLVPAPVAGLYADVSLFMAGDYVFDPEFETTSGGDVSFEEMACFGADDEFAQGIVSFEAMTCEGSVASRGAVSFEELACFGAPAGHGQGIVVMEAMTCEGDGFGVELPPDYSTGFCHFELMQCAGFGRDAVGAELSFEPLADLGVSGYGDSYGQGEVSMLPLFGWGDAYEGPNAATLWSWTAVFPPDQDPSYNIVVVMNTTVEVGLTLTLVVVEHVEMNTSITVEHSLFGVEQLRAIMNTIVTAGLSFPVTNGDAEVWVVNAETRGSTMYEDFNFNSFAKIGTQYYGAKADGLYALDGEDDNGEPIRSSISFGKRDFFTPKLKRMSNAYFGVSGSGRLFVKVKANGQEYIYATRRAQGDLAVHRADLGKGLRANYFELELYNEEGGDFELSTVEFVAATIERRI